MSGSTMKRFGDMRGYYVQGRDNQIFGTIYVDGRRRRIATGVFADEPNADKKAEKKMHALRQEYIRKGRIKRSRPLFERAWAQWVDIRSETWAPGTTIDVNGKGKYLVEFFDGYCVDEIDQESWEKFLGWMSGKGLRVAKHQDYLSSFLKFSLEKGVIQKLPVLRNPDPQSDVGKVYSREEQAKLLRHASRTLRLQILMQLKMGMRSGEVLQLAKDRIDLKENVIRLLSTDTKTRAGRVIPIHWRVLPLLKRQIETSSSPYLFPSPIDPGASQRSDGNKRAWMECKEAAKVEGRRHDLRHTCATEMAQSNINPVIAARILGMSLEVYDRIYCKPSVANLKAAMKRRG